MSNRVHGQDLPRELWDASIALDRAYAPLRARSVALSPARVRLALRAAQPVPQSVRVSRVVARFTEVALAAAVTAFAFVGSSSVAPKSSIVDETTSETVPTHVTTALEDRNFFRWIRIGRHAAASDPVDSSVLLVAGEDDNTPISHERTGLLR